VSATAVWTQGGAEKGGGQVEETTTNWLPFGYKQIKSGRKVRPPALSNDVDIFVKITPTYPWQSWVTTL